MQELCTKNQKTLLREIKADLNRCEGTTCSWIEKLNIQKSVLPKLIQIQDPESDKLYGAIMEMKL